MTDLTDVRIFIPRIRRELDPGVASGAMTYTDDMLKDVAADAVGELSLVGGDSFPYTLSVASATPPSATPPQDWEYVTDPAVPLILYNLVAIQAALTQVYREAQNFKTQEKISDEGSSWEYQRSSTLVRARIDFLLKRRQEIFDRLRYDIPELAYDSLVNTLNDWSDGLDALVNPGRYDLD